MTPMTLSQWQDEYAPILIDGVTSKRSYVRLFTRKTPTQQVALAVRPALARLSDEHVLVGCKLAAFPVPGTATVAASSDAVRSHWLLAAFPQIPWNRISAERIGVTLGGPRAVGIMDGVLFAKYLQESDYVDGLVGAIEAAVGEPGEERPRIVAALRDAYVGQIPEVCKVSMASLTRALTGVQGGVFVPLPDNVVSLFPAHPV